MTQTNIEPTKIEVTAAGVYAGGTSILYTETVYALLSPLMHALIGSLAPEMSEENKQTLSTAISYSVLLPFLAILCKTQYSAYRRTIVEYNLEHSEAEITVPEKKTSNIISTTGATFKSVATGIAAWDMFNKIPVVGKFTGAVAAAITFTGSFFTQRKFLALHGQRSSPDSTEETRLLTNRHP